MAGTSPTCTSPRGRRFRHFGAGHRISCWRIRWPVGPRQPRRHGEVGGVLISILGESGQSLYRSGRGRVPFRPAFWRGGNQPTPRRTYGGRARRGRAVGLGRRVEPLGVLGIVPEALGGGLSNPSPPLNPALLGRLARLSAVSSPIFRWLLFYEKIRGSATEQRREWPGRRQRRADMA